MLDLRAVGNAHSEIFRRRPHHAEVEAPGPAVGIDFRFRRDGLRSFTGQDIALLEIRLRVLQRHARAEAQLLRRLPGNVRVEVEGENRGRNAVIRMLPVVVVFRAHAERNRHGEAHPGALVDLVRDEPVRNCLACLPAVFLRAVVACIFQIEADADKARLHLRAGMKNHRGGIEVDARKIGTVDAHAGVSAAERTRGLFGELEARSMNGRSKGRGKSNGSCGELE